ncbi:MAG: DNA primase [Limnochordia bacterium]
MQCGFLFLDQGKVVKGLMRFPDEWIDRVKSSVDIVEVIGRTVELRQTGRNFVGLCPFHDEKTPSFTVNPEKQFFHCFGCNRGGNVFNFIMETQHVTFPEAVTLIAEERGIPVPAQSTRDKQREEKREQLRKINATAARYYYRALRQDAGEAARRYLAERGITQELAREFFLGYAQPGWDGLVRFLESQDIDLKLAEEAGLIAPGRQGYIDRFRNRIMFPICDHLGRFIGFGGRSLDPRQPKYLNTTQTPVFDKSSVLYGLNWSKDAIKQQDQAIVVEGYTDLIALFSVGKENVVASLGTAFTPRHARMLGRFCKQAVIAFDGDTAGQRATLNGLEILHKNQLQVMVARLGSDQDPDTFVRTHTAEQVDHWLSSAVPFREYQIEQIISEHDITTREGKVNASNELVQILIQMDNAVEREEYLRYVAQRLDVSEASLTAEINQKMGIDSPRPVQNRYNVKGVSVTARKDREEQLAEREIIRFLLLKPSVLSDLLETGVTAADFQHPDYRKLFAAISQNQPADQSGSELIAQLCSLEDPLGSWDDYLHSFLLILRRRRLELMEEKLSALENDSRGFDTRMELYRLIREYHQILREIP